jgi:hypothetical protein
VELVFSDKNGVVMGNKGHFGHITSEEFSHHDQLSRGSENRIGAY